jgi:hypothetical protein
VFTKSNFGERKWTRIVLKERPIVSKGPSRRRSARVIGDAKTEAEGAAEKAAGKVQNAVGGARDAVRESLKK